MTTALEQMMASPEAQSQLGTSMGINSEGGTSQAPSSATADEGKPAVTPTIASATGLTADELELISPKNTGPEPKEKSATIPGSPFVTSEAAVEAWKNLQRENAKLRDRIDKDTPQLISAGVKAELERILAEAPAVPVESEEEKTLRTDDPEAYEVFQLKKQVSHQNNAMQQLLGEINGIKQLDQVRGIQTTFAKVAKEKNVPLKALMAYGSLTHYANTPPEELAEIVRDELGLGNTPTTRSPKLADPTAGLRSPVTGGASAVSAETFNVDDLGAFGTKKWKATEKKLAQIFLQRMKGGVG